MRRRERGGWEREEESVDKDRNGEFERVIGEQWIFMFFLLHGSDQQR